MRGTLHCALQDSIWSFYSTIKWTVSNPELQRSDSFLDLVASAAPKDRPVNTSYDLNTLVTSVYPAPPANAALEMKYFPSQPSSRKSSTSPPESSQSYPAPAQDYFSGCHHHHDANSQLPPGENHICPATTHVGFTSPQLIGTSQI